MRKESLIVIIIIIIIIIINKTAMHKIKQNRKKQVNNKKESKRGISNLFDETIYSIVGFKIDVFFVFLKEEVPNKSTSENLESFRFKILLSMAMLLKVLIGII